LTRPEQLQNFRPDPWQLAAQQSCATSNVLALPSAWNLADGFAALIAVLGVAGRDLTI
jgi:hypothetical protein